MALRSLARMQQRQHLQAAQAALFRVRDGGWARKADAPPFERQRQRAQDANDLGIVVRELEPIISERLRDAVAYDNECKAEDVAAKAERFSSAPHARIGEPAVPGRNVVGELEAFKAQVSDILGSSPDSETATRRVRALLATEATRLSIFKKGGSK